MSQSNGSTDAGVSVQNIGAERSWKEIVQMTDAFCKLADLDKSQVAVNSFGYPIIPIPEVRKSGSRVRLAPRNVSPDFLGHPIYWIDPALTERREGETPERWGIRMFYVILMMGFWEENTLRWIDFLTVRDFDSFQSSIGDSPVVAYHSTAFVECFADQEEFALLDESDIVKDENGVSQKDAIEAQAAKADQMLDFLASKDQEDYTRKITSAIEMVATSLGGMPTEVNDPSKGFWEFIEPQIDAELAEYELAASDLSLSRVSVQKRLTSSANIMKAQIIGLNSSAATLTIPTLKSMGLTAIESDNLMTFINISNSSSVLNEAFNYAEQLEEKYEEISAEGVFQIFQNIYVDYQRSWERARLAYINFSIQEEVKNGEAEFFILYDDLIEKYDRDRGNARYDDTLSYVRSTNKGSEIHNLDDIIGDMGGSHEESDYSRHDSDVVESLDSLDDIYQDYSAPVESSSSDAEDLNSILDDLGSYEGTNVQKENKYDFDLD